MKIDVDVADISRVPPTGDASFSSMPGNAREQAPDKVPKYFVARVIGLVMGVKRKIFALTDQTKMYVVLR